MDKIHRNYAENSIGENETYADYCARIQAREDFKKRRTIFWYLWNYALPHYMPGKWDNRTIDTWVEFPERMWFLVHYQYWFLSYEKPKTISHMADVVDGYNLEKLERDKQKWQKVTERIRASVSHMKMQNPKLHKYLTTLPGFAAITDSG